MPPQAGTDLPTEIIDHVYGGELVEWYQRFFREREDLAADRSAIEDAVWRVYQRTATVDQFVRALEEIAGSISRAKTIAIEILGNDFLKIEDYLGIDIPAYIKHLGGDSSKFVKEIPVADVAAGIMRGIGVAPSDPVIAKRIEYAVTSFLTGVRDQLETKDVLTRGTKVGGVGLDAPTADRIVTALTIQLKELRDAGVIIRTETVKPPEASTFHLVKPSKSSVMQPEDEAEIEQFRRVVPQDTVRAQITAAVDRAIQKTGAKFKSEDISKRFRTAIESRVRDIRDYAETLDLLTRLSTAGGFGIPKEQAEKVLRVVEQEVQAVHSKTAAGQQGSRAAGQQGTGAQEPPPLKPPTPAPTTALTPQLIHPTPPHPPSSSRPFTPSVPSPTPARVAPEPVSPPPPPAPKPAPSPPPPPKPTPPAAPAPSKPQADSPKPQAPPPVVKQIPIAPPPPKPQAPPVATAEQQGKAAAVPVPPPKPLPPAPPAPPPQPALPPTPPPSVISASSVGIRAPSVPIPIPKQIPIAPPPAKPQAVSPKPEAPSPKPSAPPPTPSIAPVPKPAPSPQREIATSLPPVAPRNDLKSVPAAPSGKPKMHDIRPVPPRLVGPIEELQQLALADFRKIAKTPADAAARIAEKLALLEKDSYTKRAEGVKALRGSPLMAAYAEVLTAALLSKRKVEDEVKERLGKDHAALTLEEFTALRDLNTQIRL